MRRDANSLRTQDQAETLAIQALGYIASTGDLFDLFVNSTGMDPRQSAQSAQDPQFLAAVLDFLMQDDRRVLGFAAHLPCAPETVQHARALLPGGALPHWT